MLKKKPVITIIITNDTYARWSLHGNPEYKFQRLLEEGEELQVVPLGYFMSGLRCHMGPTESYPIVSLPVDNFEVM